MKLLGFFWVFTARFTASLAPFGGSFSYIWVFNLWHKTTKVNLVQYCLALNYIIFLICYS